MFTKYNSVNIPKNYSGNRFRQDIDDTEMKTHRPSSSTAAVTKTSVSPNFQNYLYNSYGTPKEDAPENEEKNDTFQQNDIEFSDTSTAKIENNDEIAIVNTATESKVVQLLKSIKNDDLLLLALILLLANDSNESSFDAIAILALLLMYH